MWLSGRSYSSRESQVAKVHTHATRNSRLAIPLLFFLSACGFHPMYGNDSLAGKDTALRGNISIDKMPGHEGQLLKTDLEDKFNPEGLSTNNAEYRLSIGLTKALVPTVG